MFLVRTFLMALGLAAALTPVAQAQSPMSARCDIPQAFQVPRG